MSPRKATSAPAADLGPLTTNCVAPEPDDDVPFHFACAHHEIHADVPELHVYLSVPLERPGVDPNYVSLMVRWSDEPGPMHRNLDIPLAAWVDLVRAVRQIDATGRAAGLLPEPQTFEEWRLRYRAAEEATRSTTPTPVKRKRTPKRPKGRRRAG